MHPFPQKAHNTLSELQADGLYLGTSSWKYPGWLGQLYDEQRYLTRRKFSNARFERECLAEYAETFSSVCVDASYYRFPDPRFLASIHEQVPEDFRFSHKVTDTITTRHFPNLPRHGAHSGKRNPVFLDSAIFLNSFLEPLRPYQDQTGLLILEFTRFRKGDFERGRDFLEMLDRFLAPLPTREWDFAIELRNPSLLRPEYFDLLNRHHVGHVYNHWHRMPPSGEQIDLCPPDQLEAACGMRLLLKPGRAYKEAVESFQPYERIQEERPEARQAALRFLRTSGKKPLKRKAYVYVNNRLEGNSLQTIAALLSQIGKA
ncbi:DUF72 domain-containing protein [Haloferula rosea]|uniref:DUF72 domain-containing protein n=1 Tax=Haloferula rosea TaxID=490093 RepID=A0A934VGS2_9BACT|nr:DUF72 domain-containing protein [Haloferula rosea]MBK1828346.1 DUF72 domain-containing protein [Haloferula rosea]